MPGLIRFWSSCGPSASYGGTASAALLLIFVVFATGCGGRPPTGVYVADDGGLFEPDIVSILESYQPRHDYPMAVVTADSIPAVYAGAYADSVFKVLGRRSGLGGEFARNGILLFASRSPYLVQVRLGSNLAVQAYSTGIYRGPLYLRAQSLYREIGPNSGIVMMLEYIRLHELRLEPEGGRRLLLTLLTSSGLPIGQIHERLSTPSESFYSAHLLEPFTAIRVAELRLTGSWILAFLVTGVLIAATRRVLDRSSEVVKRFFPRPVSRIWEIASGIFLIFVLTLPSAGSAILSSGARMEDRIALEELGLGWASPASLNLHLFVDKTPWWLGLLLFLAILAHGVFRQLWIMGLSEVASEKQAGFIEALKASKHPLYYRLRMLSLQDSTNPGEFQKQTPLDALMAGKILKLLGQAAVIAVFAWVFLATAYTLFLGLYYVGELAGRWKEDLAKMHDTRRVAIAANRGSDAIPPERRPDPFGKRDILSLLVVGAAAFFIVGFGGTSVVDASAVPLQVVENLPAARRVGTGTAHQVYVIADRDKLSPLRATLDSDVRRPYWVEFGDALRFDLDDRLVLEGDLVSTLLVVESYVYEPATEDPRRLTITADELTSFLTAARQRPSTPYDPGQ
jgi:hypothetical protein